MTKVSKIHNFLEKKQIVCPKPIKWNQFYNLMRKLKKDPKTKIPLPLILTGWWYSNNENKKKRFHEQIDLTISFGIEDEVFDFLNNLKDSDYIHEHENESDL